jgi:transposase-like protein
LPVRDPLYRGCRLPAEIISYAVWLYYRFHLSHRDIEDLLAERGVRVSYEAIRLWCRTFGRALAVGLRRCRRPSARKWHLDEVQLKIKGKRHWLWRAVDSDGLVLDILVQERRNQEAAERFLRRVLGGEGTAPRVVITDKLASYPPALRRMAAPLGAPSTQGTEQPGGEQSPPRAPTRTRAPAVQVAGARPAFPGALQRRAQPLPPPSPPPLRSAVPTDSHRTLPAVAGGRTAPSSRLSTSPARLPHAMTPPLSR